MDINGNNVAGLALQQQNSGGDRQMPTGGAFLKIGSSTGKKANTLNNSFDEADVQLE